MRIVALNAGEKGRLLLERWEANGHHTSAISFDAIVELNEPIDADVILLDLGGVSVNDKTKILRHLDGKTIIDCTNARNVNELHSDSASIAENVAKACPGASIVKALNVITSAALQHVLGHAGAMGREGYISAYYCGDDDQARLTTAGLIDEAHLEPVDCGPLSNAILLEALGLLAHQLEEHTAVGPHFAISVIRAHGDTSPLDRWM